MGGEAYRTDPLDDQWELYDLTADPVEAENRWTDPELHELRQHLRMQLKQQRASSVPERNQPWPYVQRQLPRASPTVWCAGCWGGSNRARSVGRYPCDIPLVTATVAVIGAGPGGLVAARWLLAQGFEPTLFEKAPTLGGQWAGLEGRSGVWPAMRTNSSRIVTAFSDLPPEDDSAYPSNRDILAYLLRYSDTFDVTSRIRFDTRVDLLRRAGKGWLLSHSGTDEQFDRVVVASGRFHAPAIPEVPGLERFSGALGATSSYHYRGPARYQGKRVLVAGSAISALEIATELAQRGAARVTVTQRRQRYVLPKFVADTPSDHRMFTRYHALACESLSADEIDWQLQAIGDRGRRKPRGLRGTGTTSVVGHGGPDLERWLSAAGSRGPNHGASVDAIGHGLVRDLRRRAR